MATRRRRAATQGRPYGAIAVVVAAALLAPSLLYPFGRDQSVFAYVAHVLQHGGLPYRDVWDLKPPAIYFLYRAILGLAGPSMPAVRAFDLAYACATSLALFFFARRYVGAVAAASAAVWYAASYLRMEYWAMAQTESFAGLPLILALWVWERGGERRSLPLSIVSGLLGGAAAALKFPAALPLLVPILLAAGRPRSGAAPGRRWLAVAVLLTAVGVAIPLVVMVVWMRVTGCWAAYLEIQRGFVAGYARLYLASLPLRGLRHTAEFLLWYLGPTLFAAAGIVRLSRERAQPALSLAAGWLLAAAAGVWAQNKFFRYHWTTALPPLCLLAGAGTEWAATALHARRGFFRIAAVALAVPVLWSAWVSGPEYVAAAQRWSGRLSPPLYATRFGLPGHGDFSFEGDRMAADYVRASGTPERGLFVWGFEPLVYLLSGSRPPTRFIFAVPLVAPWAPPKWRAELMRDLRAHPPRIILVVRHDVYPWASGRRADSAALLEQFPELNHFLQSGYRFQQVIEDFIVYRRR